MHTFSSVYIRHVSSPSDILVSPLLRHHHRATNTLDNHHHYHHPFHRHLSPNLLIPLAHSRIHPLLSHPHDHHTQIRTMAIFSSIGGVLGYETLPEGVKSKSFYDLKANLPGKDKVYDFVSGQGRERGRGRGRSRGSAACGHCVMVVPCDGGC
jgi:hypothetical protein